MSVSNYYADFYWLQTAKIQASLKQIYKIILGDRLKMDHSKLRQKIKNVSTIESFPKLRFVHMIIDAVTSTATFSRIRDRLRDLDMPMFRLKNITQRSE